MRSMHLEISGMGARSLGSGSTTVNGDSEGRQQPASPSLPTASCRYGAKQGDILNHELAAFGLTTSKVDNIYRAALYHR